MRLTAGALAAETVIIVRFASGQYQGLPRKRSSIICTEGGLTRSDPFDGHEPERSLQFSYSSATGELASSGVVLETIGDRIPWTVMPNPS